ncbi:MAG TPA: YifB family Mg chelatase-like AAA ATPase [Candidatus Mediterraneibacter pullicola]|uniref:YifB family Mg chelatase-like AAA ATPase n=1 Tax=Candidatus Mediterraneibacter pullicola TaxID=2838682 RepID=A0A9D2HBS0_9FIRM|nr:YifB family Mg chelatase-like AAA ATPase [Candidatus Mediterraneibacter pullicola]
MSFSTILSAAIDGLGVELVRVEADVSNGLPVFHMVGYLSSEVKEAGERVRTAIRNSGFDYPAKRTIVNLSPATLRKRGASFDLPIAVAIMVSLGQVSPEAAQGCLITGELGLDGRVRKVPGVLPIVMEGKQNGVTRFIVPGENKAEGSLVKGVEVIGAGSLKEVVSILSGEWVPEKREESEITDDWDETLPDFADIRGQENVKRAAEIAVAGGHNLLMIGPPGSGKSMTAKCIAGILPPPDMEESLEITKIYSVLGMLDEKSPLIRKRPFREVHHTATRAALIGGGLVPRPGEISLAHGGVLFLDELPEFRKSVIEVLRQPLEEKSVQISRTYGNYRFPADFMLVAAMNPCPCGCYPDMKKCTCTPAQIHMYLSRISRPFLDRIDLCVEARRVEYRHLADERKGECSAVIRKRVCCAREIQIKRYTGTKMTTNSMLQGKDIQKYCTLGKKEHALMEQAFKVMGLTARAYHRIIKTARTIADLEGEERIRERHLKEALGYRAVDEKFWQR